MKAKNFGSGLYGNWESDKFGLPVYRYDYDQYKIPEKLPLTNKNSVWGDYRDHFSQIGNNRIIGLISNFGYVRIRQDEGGCKFLNDYLPKERQFAGGFGYFTDGSEVLSTFYQEQKEFERYFGCGYFFKKTWSENYQIEQTLYAPFGDDPCLINQISITNKSDKKVTGKWVDYWGSEVYQITYRPMKYAQLKHLPVGVVHQFRREFSKNFSKEFKVTENGAIISHSFNGYLFPKKDDLVPSINEVNETINPKVGDNANYEDLHIPSMFVCNLNKGLLSKAYFDGNKFFENNDLLNPSGISKELGVVKDKTAVFLSTDFELAPGETKVLYYLIGYLPKGFTYEELVVKYSKSCQTEYVNTMENWGKDLITLDIYNSPESPWIKREMIWHNYFLKSSITYDDYLGNHVISQGGVYQYIYGHRCGTRDLLQHIVPLIYSCPEMAKELIDNNLRLVDETGWVYDGITGDGVISDDDPREDKPSSALSHAVFGTTDGAQNTKEIGKKVPVEGRFDDEELWLLWVVSEYVMATKDYGYLDEVKIGYFSTNNKPRTVLEIVTDCFDYIKNEVGTGKNGLIRLLLCDWSRVLFHKNYRDIPLVDKINAPKIAESVFTSSLAVYCCNIFAKMLKELDSEKASEVEDFSKSIQNSLENNWNGKWMQRAWISDSYGFVGDENEFLMEGQPWTLVGQALSEEKLRTIIKNINELVMKPSPIGAAKQRLAPGTNAESHDGWVWWSLNGPLIWGIVPLDNELAYKEYLKNSLGWHANEYPDVWFGIWSNGDNYTSFMSEYPGYTRWEAGGVDILSEKKLALEGKPVKYETPSALNFPIGNLHAHAWPLYLIFKLLQLNFNRDGVSMTPSIPREEYEISSKLIGYIQTKTKISGWYAPLVDGTYTFELDLRNVALCANTLQVNSVNTPYEIKDTKIIFKATSSKNQRIEWCFMNDMCR